MKLLTILDCYIHNDTILNKLDSFIDKLKSKNSDILLISNTIIPIGIQNKVDYCLYDSNNHFFSNDWEFSELFVVKTLISGGNCQDVFPKLQPHGLSVMINIFNAITIGKSLGYTHFEKLEYDPLFSDESFNNLSLLPSRCLDENKKGLYLLNNITNPPDVSFHYFFSEIDYFLSNVKNIKSESDYRDFINQTNGNNFFINVERFLYQNLVISGLENFVLIDEEERDLKFPNTYWNSEVSPNNIPKKYNSCTSRLYFPMDTNEYVVLLSMNYDNKHKERIIKCHFDDGFIYTSTHHVTSKGCYTYDSITPNIQFIEVFENGELLYTEHISEVNNLIEIS